MRGSMLELWTIFDSPIDLPDRFCSSQVGDGDADE